MAKYGEVAWRHRDLSKVPPDLRVVYLEKKGKKKIQIIGMRVRVGGRSMPILLFYAEGRLYRAKAKANNDLSCTGEDCHGVACETSGAIYAFFFEFP